jgi:L-threonylcarbamoyladenylate synthase
MPAHPVALELIRAAGLPIAAPSANLFTGLSPTTADHVRGAFGDRVMVLDGGATAVGIESAVVSLTGPEPVLLRPGIIPFADIRRVTDTGPGAHPSPGMHQRHYSPRTPLLLVDGAQLPMGRVAYLWWGRCLPAAKSVKMPPSPEGYAAALYRTLHELDGEGWDVIAVERLPEDAAWAGIADRLTRASR